MVFKDIFNGSTLSPGGTLNERRRFKAWRIPLADPLSRWAALVVDLFVILAPLISLFLSSVKKQVIISEWLGKGLDYQVYILIYLLLAFMIVILYQGLFTAFFGGTPGKLFFGLRVVSIWNEEKPGVGASMLRALYWCIGALLFFLPQLAIFYHRERRPIYDRLADTVVIAQEKYAVGPPETGFGGLLRFTLSFVYVGFFIMVTNSLYVVFEENRKHQTANLFWQSDEQDSCQILNRHISSKDATQPQVRMQKALSLFAIEKIDEECLDREADNVLWNFDEVTSAYAAKAMLFMDEKSVYTKYLLKTCQGKGDREYCLLLRALKSENQVNQTANLEKIYFNLSRSSHDDIKIWSLKHWLKNHEYNQALSLIDDIRGEGEIASYLAENRAKALWAKNQFSQSRAALYTFLPTAAPQEKLYTNSWFCYHEAIMGCTEKQERLCNSLMTDLASYQITNLESELLIPIVRRAECEKTNKINYGDFLKAANSLALRDYIGALMKKTTQPEVTRAMLTELLTTKNNDPMLKTEAAIRLLTLSENPKTLDFVYNEWKEKKMQFGDHWVVVGQKIFDGLYAARRYAQSFDTGRKISRIVENPHFMEKWVISAYKSGHTKEAWDVIASQRGEVGTRGPASNREIEEIKSELKRKFSK